MSTRLLSLVWIRHKYLGGSIATKRFIRGLYILGTRSSLSDTYNLTDTRSCFLALFCYITIDIFRPHCKLASHNRRLGHPCEVSSYVYSVDLATKYPYKMVYNSTD